MKSIGIAVATIEWALVPMIADALRKAERIYVCGNGGSAANAMHLVLHLNGARLKAHNMFGDMAYVTAVSNDRSFETAQRNYLRFAASPQDALVAISGSGDSANVLLALTEARRLGMRTIGLLGMGGGGAAQLCDLACIVASNEYGVVEDAHSAIIHVFAKLLAARGGDGQPRRASADITDARTYAHQRKRASIAKAGRAAKSGSASPIGGIPGTEGGRKQAPATAPGGEG